MRKPQLLALMTVLSLAAVACGGDNTTPSAGGTTQPPGTSPQPTANPVTNEGTLDATGMTGFELELDDKYFKPTFIKATPGQSFKIELKNEGALAHTFTIASGGLNMEKILQPDSTMDVDVAMPAGGGADLAFFCKFHGTEGMRGAFFFGATPSASAGTGSSGGYGSGNGY